jgi:hypothetical protein
MVFLHAHRYSGHVEFLFDLQGCLGVIDQVDCVLPSTIRVLGLEVAQLENEQNKGKESSAYLQYILDNYDKLPEYMVFLHAHR